MPLTQRSQRSSMPVLTWNGPTMSVTRRSSMHGTRGRVRIEVLAGSVSKATFESWCTRGLFSLEGKRGRNLAFAAIDNIPVLEQLIARGVDVLAPDADGLTLLELAPDRGHAPAATLLQKLAPAPTAKPSWKLRDLDAIGKTIGDERAGVIADHAPADLEDVMDDARDAHDRARASSILRRTYGRTTSDDESAALARINQAYDRAIRKLAP